MSEIIISDEQKAQMEHVVVKKLTDEECLEIHNVWKINRGETCEKNFSELIKFGTPIKREDGRVPFAEIDEKELYNYLKELEFDDIEDGFGDEIFINPEVRSDFIEDCQEEDDTELLNLFLAAEKQLKELEEKGFKYNTNVMWEIRHIITGRKQRYYLEREGNNVDFLIKWYSYIPKRKFKRIKARVENYYKNRGGK